MDRLGDGQPGHRPEMPRYRWENFTTENGLPDNHVFQVKVDGPRVWAATENGLALYQNGRWKVYGTARRPGSPRRTVHRRGPADRRSSGQPPWAA